MPRADETRDDDIPDVLHLDEHAVRVLAHPLRSRLLTRLRVDGPLTATELAGLLGTNSGATSYHLRALASVGLVADAHTGQGRERKWRAASRSHAWVASAFADDEDARTALGWLQRDYVRQFAARADEWLDAADAWPAEWVDALGLSDALVEVTPAGARALQADLAALIERYRTEGAGDPTARRIHVHTFARPVELAPAPADGAPAEPES